jgi:hypothetical protein
LIVAHPPKERDIKDILSPYAAEITPARKAARPRA